MFEAYVELTVAHPLWLAFVQFQALLREIEGQQSHEKLAAELRARLAALEGK